MLVFINIPACCTCRTPLRKFTSMYQNEMLWHGYCGFNRVLDARMALNANVVLTFKGEILCLYSFPDFVST